MKEIEVSAVRLSVLNSTLNNTILLKFADSSNASTHHHTLPHRITRSSQLLHQQNHNVNSSFRNITATIMRQTRYHDRCIVIEDRLGKTVTLVKVYYKIKNTNTNTNDADNERVFTINSVRSFSATRQTLH